jgi:uncharacterized linocin/CFP29 family protein
VAPAYGDNVQHLMRELAPLSAADWQRLDDEVGAVLKPLLAGRRIVDFDGPKGWQAAAVPSGRAIRVDGIAVDSVEARLRAVQPLVEARVTFALPRAEIDTLGRGGTEIDLTPLQAAARAAARFEDGCVFMGCANAHIRGIGEVAGDRSLPLPADFSEFPTTLAHALESMRDAGVSGPYGLVLDPDAYSTLLHATHRGGYPVIEHVRQTLDGPIVLTGALRGGLLVSLRGGDFRLTVGQDFALGYLSHTEASVTLYLEETFTFVPAGPEAAVPLTAPRKGKSR